MSWLGCTPDGCDLRWVEQGLQDHAILFCFLLQDTQFICGRLGSVEMEFDPNGFEPDWHFEIPKVPCRSMSPWALTSICRIGIPMAVALVGR